MTALKVNLEGPQELFVDEQVRSGAYPDADAVICAALDRLKADAEIEARKEARFAAMMKSSIEQVERGEVERVDDIRAWLDGLGRRPARSA
jgi:putative addiction module CopG family antidote